LAPTLHCAELNSNIDFDACPFAPQRKLADWPRLHSPNGEVPRRASVSSFGAGGGNAHVILEEPPVVEHTESSGNQPQLFPFSATTPARLAECLRVYLSWLGGKDLPSAARVAFSLQTTREMRHERVAFICDDLEELAVAIRAYLDDPRESSRTYVGEKQGASRPLWQADTADFELLVRRWVETGALFKVADYWAKGGELNWEWLWPEGSSPARVRLPATPLMRSTHVLPQLARTCDAAALVPRGGHPLVAPLDANLYRLRYGARFDADDVILRDHVIEGELVVPGVAYLEAALFAAGAATEGNARRLQNITWQRPIILMNGVSNATLELSAAAEGLCITLGNDGLTCLSAEAPFVPADSAHSVDVAVPEVSGSRIAGPEFYRRLATAGMHYGRALQVVESLTCGKGRVVARLRPAVELTGYRIWPDLLDGAFQALAGFLMERDLSPAAYMPFSLEALEVFGEWPHEACTASLELSSAANGNAELVAADLQIISDDGRLLVSLKNLVVRRRAPACDSHVLELLRRFRDDELSFSEATNLLTEFHHVEHS
jgi:acyl transferase domain-containing protein